MPINIKTKQISLILPILLLTTVIIAVAIAPSIEHLAFSLPSKPLPRETPSSSDSSGPYCYCIGKVIDTNP